MFRFLALLLLVGAPLLVRADDAPAPRSRLLVVAFTADGVDAKIANVLEVSLCNAVEDAGGAIVCSDELAALDASDNTKKQLGLCDGPAAKTCRSVADLVAAAKYRVTGKVAKKGEAFALTVSLVDLGTSETALTVSETTTRLEALLDRTPAMAKKLLAQK